MEEVNKNTEVDNTDKKLHISDVSFSLWEYGTCWVKTPSTDRIITHTSRRNKKTKVVQFFFENTTCDNGKGYWIDVHEGWWNNFIPAN
jgi:hypothetical protein